MFAELWIFLRMIFYPFLGEIQRLLQAVHQFLLLVLLTPSLCYLQPINQMILFF